LTLCEGTVDFLQCEAKVEASSQALMASEQALMTCENGLRYSAGSQGVPRRMTGLHLCAYFGLNEAANALLNLLQGPDSKDIYGRTPLLWAVVRGHECIVKLLLETGKVDANSKDNNRLTSLSYAAMNGQETIVQLFHEKGNADAALEYDGRTPLLWAVIRGYEGIVKLLLEMGTSYVNSKDKLSWCRNTQIYGHCRYKVRGCYFNHVNPGRTSLSWAVANGQETIVKLLLEKCANIESKDAGGRTPLSLAAERGNEAVVKLLLNKRRDRGEG